MAQLAVSMDDGTDEWKRLVFIGNQAFDIGHWSIALEQYNLALREAVRNYTELMPADPDLALASVVVTYMNLASVHYSLRNESAVLDQFEKAGEFLLRQLTFCRSNILHDAISHAYRHLKHDWLLMRKQLPDLEEPVSMRLIEEKIFSIAE